MAQAARSCGDFLYHQVENAAIIAGEFVERHFTTISFLVSSIFMGMFSLPMLVIGGAIGAALHHRYDPNLKIDRTAEKVVSVVHATLAIVGAVACFVMLTGAGSFTIAPIPFLASFAVGSGAYRAYASFLR